MSAADLAAVVAAVTCLAVVGVGTALVLRLRATVSQVDRLVAEVRDEVDAALDALAADRADIAEQLHRVDGLVATAERVSARADSLSRVTYGAVARPVIRTAAVVKGTSRAARRLRGVGDEPTDPELPRAGNAR